MNELHGGRGDDMLTAFNLTDSESRRAPVGENNSAVGDEGNDVLVATHSTDGEKRDY